MIKNYFVAQPNAFVGRKHELADVGARLTGSECRLLTLTGLGGSGKTRLGIEAAQAIASDFQHGVVFVNLQPITRTDLLTHTIAQALGLTLYSEDDPEANLLSYLREKSLLLLLDNFEHLLSGTPLLSSILTHAPQVKILVTSREPLNLQEEWLYPVRGMSIPLSAFATTVEDYEAVQLFMYHARRIQPSFVMANEQESVIQICQMSAGLPLAIELAAAWLKGLTASQIAAEMRDNLDFLSSTTRNVEPRHRSMRAVFDHSWKLMLEDERQIFAALSVFVGSFDHAAAEHVAGASLSDLVALVEKSLLQPETSNRFSIHELLRQFATEKLEENGALAATKERHCQYYAHQMLGHETALKQSEQMNALRMIESDFENSRLAWEWAAKNQKLAYLHEMLNGLYLFGFLGSRHCETSSIFEHTLEQVVSDVPLWGQLLVRRWGFLHWWYQADYQEPLTNIEQGLAIAGEENNPFEMAFCHLMIAYAMISMQRLSVALPHLETSKTLFEEIHEPYYVCWVLHRLGYVYCNLNHIDKGNEYTEESLSLARATHNRFSLFNCLFNLGSDYVLNGDSIKAKHYGKEALQFAAESGHPCQAAHGLSLLALDAFIQGDYNASQEYAERSQAMIEDINPTVLQPYGLSLLIILACLREDYAEGIRLNELGKHHSTSRMDYQLHNWALAALSCGMGSVSETRLYIQSVFQWSRPNISPIIIHWIVPFLAYTVAESAPEKAIELLAWVVSNPDTAVNWVRRWPLFDHLQTQLQNVMGRDVYQNHWEKGSAQTMDSIAAYLREEFVAVSETAAPKHLLTAREGDILRLIATGLTNPQIAEELVIGPGTVKTHTLNIYRKLEVANRTQAITRAQELGLLPLNGR